jgi:F-type H+-transporting ATPase subunit a
VHWYGIRIQGLKSYLQHYLKPSPILLPFHLLSEVTRTIALAVRLFGNMMSLEMVALLILMVAGFLMPVPILMLHIVEALVQAYIFGMLALIYIAGGLQTQQPREQTTGEDHD